MDDNQPTRPAPRAFRRNALVVLVAVIVALAAVVSVVRAGGDRRTPTADPNDPQVIAAGTSDTNLPTESSWAGAQNPPYICCWGSNGQYVTFSFSVPAGKTNLVLRYSAANAAAYRKLLVDGAVWKATQVFAKTVDWSTWKSLTLSRVLTAGAHTLTMTYDSAAASSQFLNLDNLTVVPMGVSPPPTAGVSVALGYADGATPLVPWLGSADTVFIGSPPQCCVTYGKDVGKNGYDGGAIQVTNSTTAPIVVDAVTVDFDGGSSPSHFDLWGGGGAGQLPQTLAAGKHLILTMTSGFNFDTSDLLGEACILNSGARAVVHISVNGTVTDYVDDHQILNADGTDRTACPGSTGERHVFTTVSAGTQPHALPKKDVAPAVAGVATTGRVLSGFGGGWNGSPPPTLTLSWTRCSSTGTACVAITGAQGATYRPVAADVGHKLKVQVKATNSVGSAVASSAATAVVTSGPAVRQFGNTSTGATSVFVFRTNQLGSVFTAPTAGTTIDFSFFARGAGSAQKFTPKIYSVVNGQAGSLLATGVTMTVPKASRAKWYVSKLAGLHLDAGTQYFLALNPSGTYNGTYVGSETDLEGPMSFFVDYAP